MSKNINQVFIANPITINASTDLMYFGQSPYGAGNDAAMTYANFSAQFGAPYTASALTAANDTNVTLTLGGTPATSLLHAASITAGWTGTLSGTRGGTGVNNGSSTITIGGNFAMSGAFSFTGTLTNTTAVTFPTSGTLATTSQLPTPAALTATNDTNVTLTLGGTPATALLQASSITAGWAGQLSVARGGTGVSSVTTSPTATAFAGWDGNKNLSANSFIDGYTTTATAAGTTTLTVSSTQQQFFTGTTTQTVLLPVTSTLVLGQSFTIVNNSTGVVTVQSSGANTIQAMAASSTLVVTCILISGTTAASWSATYITAGSGATGAQIQQQAFTYVAAGGTANAITATYSPAVSSLTAGSEFSFKVATSNTGATTLDVGTGATAVRYDDGSATAFIGGELVAGQIATVVYDGTNFLLKNPATVVYTNGIRSIYGRSATRNGNDNLVVGLSSSAGSSSLAVGQGAVAGGNSVAIGNSTNANHTASVCLATGSTGANGAVAIGQGNPFAGGVGSYALGDGASISGAHSYGLGFNAAGTNNGSFIFNDSNGTSAGDSAANQFVMTFAGGYFFNLTNTSKAAQINTTGVMIDIKGRADQSYSLQTPATGFSITIGNNVSMLILNPAGTLATGTITMPASPIDGQEIRFSSSQIVTALTVSANTGQTISNAPTTISAGQGFGYIYNLSGTNWFRIY